MTQHSSLEPEYEACLSRTMIPGCLILSLFWILTCWSFFEDGIYVLGLNATFFLLLFYHILTNRVLFSFQGIWQDWRWDLPLFMLCLSYAFYDNPFYKCCNVLALPVAFALVAQRRVLADPDSVFRNLLHTVSFVAYSIFVPLLFFVLSAKDHAVWLFGEGRFHVVKTSKAKSVLKGVSVLFLISVVVVIPLLASVDPAFHAIFDTFMVRLHKCIEYIFGEEFVMKVVMFFVISICVLASALAWMTPIFPEKGSAKVEKDSIVAAIVLGGISLLYLLFLVLQVDKLFLQTLPLSFQETESYVKQGFWQLIFLSSLNIYFIYYFYRQISKSSQRVLVGFVWISLFLLLSAAHRMYLYVTLYGLSYEKFYASYAVLYCFVMLTICIYTLMRHLDVHILRSCFIVLFWMYAVVGLLPVEQIIVRFNLAQSVKAESRVQLSDLHMLSVDALSYVKKHREQFKDVPLPTGWTRVDQWIHAQEQLRNSRAWYERSLSSL